MPNNIFEEMDNEQTVNTETTQQEKIYTPGEIDFEKLSNVPIGEQKKYERQNLDGKTVVIAKAQLFEADTRSEPSTSMDKKTEYYKCNFILHYETENEDREYLSGVRQLVQKDGSLSPYSFWYAGAQHQVAELWEKVAKFKNKPAEELSPREFMAFLNSKPKAVLKSVTFKNPVDGGSVTKNMVERFVA